MDLGGNTSWRVVFTMMLVLSTLHVAHDLLDPLVSGITRMHDFCNHQSCRFEVPDLSSNEQNRMAIHSLQ